MGISHIPNPEEQFASTFRPGWFVGWHVGWWTGWWNPFDRFKEIDPREVGVLTVAQGDIMIKQAELFAKQGELVKQLGQQFTGLRGGGGPTKG